MAKGKKENYVSHLSTVIDNDDISFMYAASSVFMGSSFSVPYNVFHYNCKDSLMTVLFMI